MKISRVDILPVSVPFIEPFVIAGGRACHGRHVVVRVVSKDGEVGYGESAPMSSYSSQTQESVVGEIERVKSLLIGKQALDLGAIHLLLDQAGTDCFARAGLDIALHDLIGRSLGLPICQLLGGPVAEGVDLSWAIGFKPAEEMAKEAKRYASIGFKTVKIKIGDEPGMDVERVASVREAVGPDVIVKVDANQGYDLGTAVAVGRELERYDIAVFEQPLPRDALDDLAELRRRVRIPLMVDESLYGPRDALEILRRRAADIFNIKIMKPGGIRPSAKLVSLAEGAGMPCMLGSMPELGIGTLGGLQLAVTSKAFTWGAELIGPWMFGDDLLRRKPRLVEGRLMLPRGPGIGVDVDERKVERHACPGEDDPKRGKSDRPTH